MLRLAGIVFVAGLSAGMLQCGNGGGSPPGSDAGADPDAGGAIVALTFVSDQSIILHGRGETHDFDVAGVTAEGELVTVSELVWTSSDETAVIVDGDGVATAATDMGQAVVTATSGELEVSGTAFVAVAAPNTRRAASADVIWQTATSLRLTDAAAYGEVQVGDILVSGSVAGVLVRVLAIEPAGEALDLTVERVSLADAYVRLHVDFATELTEDQTEPLTVGEGESGQAEPGTTASPMVVRQSPLGLPLVCEGGFEGPGVTIDPPSVTVRPSLSFRPTIDIAESRVTEFTLQATAGVQIDLDTGSVAVDLTGELSGDCHTELDEFSLGAIIVTPIGPFKFDVSLTPQFGFRGSLSFDGGEITAAGPSYSIRASKTSGIRYTPAAGFELIDEEPVFTEDYQPPLIQTNLDADVTVALTPYVRVEVGVGVGYGPGGPIELELVEVRFASIEFFVEGALSMGAPFAPDDPAYAGPSWVVTPGIAGEVMFALGGDSALGWALEAVGVPTSTEPLFRLEYRFDPIIESPVPEVEVTVQEDTIGLVATVAEPFHQGTVDFLVFPAGERSPLDLGDGSDARPTDQFGRALFVWRFDPVDDVGRYAVVARFTHASFGLPGLPYASDPSLPAMFRIDPPLEPPPPPPEIDPATTRLTFGRGNVWAIVDGTLYEFSATCIARPEDCDCDTNPENCALDPQPDLDGVEVVAVASAVGNERVLVVGSSGQAWLLPLPGGCESPLDCPFGGLVDVAGVEAANWSQDDLYYAVSQSGSLMTWGAAGGCTMLARPGGPSDCAGEVSAPQGVVWEPLVLDGEDCTDGLDNDGDLLIDCEDPACAESYHCTPPPLVTKVRLGALRNENAEVGYFVGLDRNLWLFGEYLDDAQLEFARYPTIVLGPDAQNPEARHDVVDVACRELPTEGCLALMESGDLWDPRDSSTWVPRGDEVAILGRNANFAVDREGYVVPTALGSSAWLSDYLTIAGGIREMDSAVALASQGTETTAVVVALLSDEAIFADLAIWVGVDRDDFEDCSEAGAGNLDYRTNGCPTPILLDVDLD